MHYFKRNIGDYHKKAGRLSMLEHGAYTLLMDSCYDREKFPTEQEAIDWCWARSEAEINAVKFVLSKFFTLQGGIYVQQRIADEIEAFHAKSLKNQQIAIEREKAKRTKRAQDKHETCEEHHVYSTNEHLTTNHKPLTINTNPPNPLEGGEAVQQKKERKPRTSLKTFVDRCRQNNEKPISGYEPLLAYVQSTGLPMDYVQLAWEVFKSEFMPGGTNESRLQADWRKHFLNYIRKGYYRLWFAKPAGDGNVQYELTTQGHQARMIHKEAA